MRILSKWFETNYIKANYKNLLKNTHKQSFVGVLKKWTLVQVFPCKLCEILKNNYFVEYL